MTNTPIVKSITLRIGNKELELSPEECKALKGALDEMFPAPVKVVEQHHHHHRDWWLYPHVPKITYNLETCNEVKDYMAQDGEMTTRMLSLECNYEKL